jgi:hypothetical protein
MNEELMRIARHREWAIRKRHAAELNDCMNSLLLNVPLKGGHVDRQILRRLLRTAFIGGVVAQQKKPTPLRHHTN